MAAYSPWPMNVACCPKDPNNVAGDLIRVPGATHILANIQNLGPVSNRSIEVPNPALERDIGITQCLPEDPLARLGRGEITSLAVTTAFLRRASIAQDLGSTNCITELLPERALARAKELDDCFSQHKKPIGPLHGLPISVKEMIGMKNLGLNAGYVACWGKTATENAHILDVLRNPGAVFHARITQPQSMMHLETDNNLYGTTVDPYNINVSSGGSSGCEGALFGMRGSCLGFGSDIGGSVRSPAANCRIYGFKPTAFRLPTDGWCSTQAGADPISAVVGPMSTSLQGIKIIMKLSSTQNPGCLIVVNNNSSLMRIMSNQASCRDEFVQYNVQALLISQDLGSL